MRAEVPSGILHGDPFLDNILVHPVSGALSGFVDLGDVAVGPCLFDLACCASACCFDEQTNTLDTTRLRALLAGYVSRRPLAAAEAAIFVDFISVV